MITSMDTFNIVAGLVTIGSLFFSLWIFLRGEKSKAVELERFSGVSSRLEDMLHVVRAMQRQGSLIAAVADREETSKKELKHLCVSLLATLEGLEQNLSAEARAREQWRFGVPSRYLVLPEKVGDGLPRQHNQKPQPDGTATAAPRG